MQLNLWIHNLYPELTKTVHQLEDPPSGPYRPTDYLWACGSQDGSIVVLSEDDTFVDFYDPDG